jgi:hypothetical protein
MEALRNCGERKSTIEMRSRNSEQPQNVIRSFADTEKPAADTITTNCQAEAVSQNAVGRIGSNQTDGSLQ